MLTRLMEYVKDSFNITIIAVLLITFSSAAGIAMNTFNNLNDKQAEKARMLEYSKYSAYDGGSITGDRVIAAARKFSRESGFYIYVAKGSSTYGVDIAGNGTACYSVNVATAQTSASNTFTCSYRTSNLTTETSPVYIKLTDVYRPIVLTDGHGAVTGLHFTKL